MEVDILIIGQGISGTLLSWFLQKENTSYHVIDNHDLSSASRVAAGIINPVTGRRVVTTWLIDEILPFAEKIYNEMGDELGIRAISQKNIIEFFPNPQRRLLFVERINEGGGYLRSFPDQNHFRNEFNFDFGTGEIFPCYTVHMQELLYAWRNNLKNKNLLTEGEFSEAALSFTSEGVRYENITAKQIIFCDGIASANWSYFKMLPFSINKGEAILIEADLPTTHVFKKSYSIVPLRENLFWVGSNYTWDYVDANPNPAFLKHMTDVLDRWLKAQYKIVEHRASLRPSTMERRPFVGMHPHIPQIGILNGMGTKGSSLAPYFANQLVQHLVHQRPIHTEANIHRYKNILLREVS